MRAVVLTGAGDHFCARQDLAEHAQALAGDPDNVFATVVEDYSPMTSSLATNQAELGDMGSCAARLASDSSGRASAGESCA